MMAEINVTPFVDVMLVLLIVFMVTAPLMTLSIRVDLPDTRGGTALNSNKAPLNVTVKKTGGGCSSQVDLFLDKTPTTLAAMAFVLKGMVQPGDPGVVVNADSAAPEGTVVEAMLQARRAGVEHFLIAVKRE